jgi:hypothetical protein
MVAGAKKVMRFGIAGLVLCCLISCQPDLTNPINKELGSKRLEDIGDFKVKVNVSADSSEVTFYVTSEDSLYDKYLDENYIIGFEVNDDPNDCKFTEKKNLCNYEWKIVEPLKSKAIASRTINTNENGKCYNVEFTISESEESPQIHIAEWWLQPQGQFIQGSCRKITQD